MAEHEAKYGIVAIGRLLDAGEPIFVLRAQDQVAVETLLDYKAHARDAGADGDLLESVGNEIERFAKWRMTHPVKVPD